MGSRTLPLLACVVVLAASLAGCSATSMGTADDLHQTFTLAPKGAVASATSIPFDVALRGDLHVQVRSEPGPVLVVLQKASSCGSFADQSFLPTSRYEKTEANFTYFVPERGGYCLSFQNRNAEPITVTAHVTFP